MLLASQILCLALCHGLLSSGSEFRDETASGAVVNADNVVDPIQVLVVCKCSHGYIAVVAGQYTVGRNHATRELTVNRILSIFSTMPDRKKRQVLTHQSLKPIQILVSSRFKPPKMRCFIMFPYSPRSYGVEIHWRSGGPGGVSCEPQSN